MSRYEDSCPFEPSSRANRCKSCVAASGLPPCVAAFLSGQNTEPASNVIQLRRIEIIQPRKAA